MYKITVPTLTEAENLYNKLEADNIAAKAVAEKIKAIGTVAYTAESKALIDAARKAYDGLTADQKALVKDVNTLTGAETAYNKLKADHDAADAVTAKINAIGTVAYNQQTKTKIDAARTSYDALTAEQKALVKEAEVKALENAEKTYTDVDVAYTKINSIKPVALDDSSKKEIEEARVAYEKLTDDEKKLLPNYSKLTNSEAQYNKLVEDNKSSTTMTIVISSVGVLILIGVVVYMVLFKKKEDK